jgi:hypothetical protein
MRPNDITARKEKVPSNLALQRGGPWLESPWGDLREGRS